MKIRWGLAVLALVASACVGAEGKKQDKKDLDVIPVFEGDENDLEPLTPSVEWTLSGNLQGDMLANSDLPSDREDKFELRRARMSALIEWRNDWRLKVGIDFAEKNSSPTGGDVLPLRDLSVEYRGWPVYLEAGQFVEPFGLLQSSSRGAALMERPQASGIGPGYGIGVAANMRLGSSGGLSFGLFTPTRNDVFFGGHEDNAVTLRGTYVPYRSDDVLLHVGAAVSLREPDTYTLQFVTIPESVLLLGLNTSSQRLITDQYTLLGFELAAQAGPVLVQGEFIQANVSDAISFDDLIQNGTITQLSPSYNGYYLEGAWAITGERRDYSVRRGTFSGIEPAKFLFGGGIGAFEVAARYGSTDLRDDTGRGERSSIASVGLNWYPLEYAKVMLEGLDITQDEPGGVREKARAIQLRMQLHFTVP